MQVQSNLMLSLSNRINIIDLSSLILEEILTILEVELAQEEEGA